MPKTQVSKNLVITEIRIPCQKEQIGLLLDRFGELLFISCKRKNVAKKQDDYTHASLTISSGAWTFVPSSLPVK